MIMAMMKSSNTEWLGDIPAEWDVAQIGNYYELRNEKVSDYDFEPLSVTMKGIVPQLATAAKSDDHSNRKLVKKGDFVINSRSDRRGSCGISPLDGSVSLINIVMEPRGEMNPQYYNWLFHTEQFADEFYKWGHGIVDDLWTTRWQEMKKILIVAPSPDEQQAIADYLDETCSQIDEIIAEAKASIYEYKNFRQSVISEAVLNGIEQHNYKNVDLEWIASIPDTWGVLPLKRYFTYQKGLPITKADLLENGDKVISYGQIHAKFNTGVTVDERLIRYVSHEYSLSNSESLCSKGDIILADTSEDKDGCGNAVYIDTDEMIFAGYHTIILKSNVDNKYLAYLFTSDIWRSQIRKRVQGVKLFSVTLKILNQCSIILPPVNEQIDIVKYLDEKTAIIDACISEKESLINDLEAYKKSLIYEVVTGKRRVV